MERMIAKINYKKFLLLIKVLIIKIGFGGRKMKND